MPHHAPSAKAAATSAPRTNRPTERPRLAPAPPGGGDVAPGGDAAGGTVPAAAESSAGSDTGVVGAATGSTSALSMASDEALALMSWLESAPPGSHYLPGSADSPNPN